MNVGYILRRSCEIFAENTAIISEDDRVTFHEVGKRTNRLVNGFCDLGLRKGDRVGMLLKNSREALEVYLALIKGGLVRVPINVRLSPREVTYILRDSGAKALIFSGDTLPVVEKIKEELPELTIFICIGAGEGTMAYEEVVAGGSSTEPGIQIDTDDLMDIRYTSGTTGHPKGALMTHRRFLSFISKMFINPITVPTSADVMLHIAPLTAASNNMIVLHFIKGAANAVPIGSEIPLIFQTIEKIRATTTLVVPTLLNMLLNHPDIDRYDLSSLRCIYYGSSPMPQTLMRNALRKFGPIFTQYYGMGEVAPASILLPFEHKIDGTPEEMRRMSSAGKPAYMVDLRIVNEKGEDVKPGEIGEIIHRGEHVFKGYWKNPEATAEAFKDGWFYSGDMATFDEDGYIYFMDRKKDMIISGGYNIYPSEVENVLHQHPAVFEAVVVAVPDEKWGEVVQAVLVLKQGKKATGDEVIAFCKDHLSRFKAPHYVEFADALPKNPAGKILRKEVREKYWKGQIRRVH